MSQLIVPPDKRTGCKLRASKPGQWCSLWGEKMEVIPPEEWPDLIGTVELSPHVQVILDQDGVGSCATESLTGAVMLSRVMRGEQQVQLNPWFIYHHTSGGVDNGSSIDENLRFVTEHGIAPEHVWPRSKGWQAAPSDAAYEAADDFRVLEWWDVTTVAEIGSALLKGFPIVFGWSGHSVYFVDLVVPTAGLYVNSWGAAWNTNGMARLSLASVNFAYGAFAVRVAD